VYFITAADTKFYFFLPYMAAQIERLFPKARLIVYDLGMTEQETLQLSEWGVEVKKWHIGPGEAVKAPNYYPRALHKPSMILDALERYPNETAVYLDADAIPNRKFSVPTGCDVAVTLIDQHHIAWIESNPQLEFLGVFNTGVIFFGRSKRRLELCREWTARMHLAEFKISDQSVLSTLIEESEGHNRQEYNVTRNLNISGTNVRIRILDALEWNLFALRCNILCGKDRILPEATNVLHFKGQSMHLKSDFENCMKMGKMDLQTKGVSLC